MQQQGGRGQGQSDCRVQGVLSTHVATRAIIGRSPVEQRTLGDVTPRRPDARLQVWAIALGLGALALLLYTWRLDTSPIYLQHDEIFFALQAQAISTTGHDSNGRLLPVYFEVERGHWFQPAIIYAMALVFKAVPPSIAAIRTPTAIVGAVNVVLMFFIARRLFHRTGIAVLAPLMLTLTPAHFIHSRVAMDYLFPIPFVLGWLLCLLAFHRDAERSWCC